MLAQETSMAKKRESLEIYFYKTIDDYYIKEKGGIVLDQRVDNSLKGY